MLLSGDWFDTRWLGITESPTEPRVRGPWGIGETCWSPTDGARFARWAKMIGEDSWLTDPRFKDDQARGNHAEQISSA